MIEALLARFTPDQVMLAFSGAILTLSVFDTILLFWLGFVMVLTAARRNLGICMAAAGLLAGGVFFTGHTALVVLNISDARWVLGNWWRVGWIALVIAPFAWYGAVLWHMGYWERRDSRLRREHRPLLALAGAATLVLLVVVFIARPIPSGLELISLYFASVPTVWGIPLVALLYPLFIFMCTGAAALALQRPEPLEGATRITARDRARPWLLRAAYTLVSLAVFMCIVLVWMVSFARQSALDEILRQPRLEAFVLDFGITLLVTIAIVLIGESAVVYEAFTGRSLPRQGLRRQWRYLTIVAAGYSLAGGVGFAVQFSLNYLTAVILMMTVFLAFAFALVSWRTYLEREQYIAHLRPFVTSEHVYEALLSPEAPRAAGPSGEAALVPLCEEVLGASSACLVPVGSLSALIPEPLTYPPGAPTCDVSRLLTQCTSPEVIALPLDPREHAGAVWAVALRSARGLIGLLLLGKKSDGGLYAQEEIELARMGGERLLDSLAAASLAQRLMALQRERFIESQVLDQQSRRALHDEILPSLHAAMLSLRAENAQALEQLTDVHRRVSALLREMPSGLTSEVGKLGLLGAVRQMVEKEMAADFDGIEWDLAPEAEAGARALPTLTADVIFYAAKEVIRNSARHGRGGEAGRPLRLRISAAWNGGLELRISDDGVGPVSAGPSSGGHGLALHSTMMAVLGGSLVSEPREGGGTAVTIGLPQG